MSEPKNFLVTSLYKLKGWTPWWDRSPEGDLYAQYSEMSRIMIKSFKHFLQGEWELIVLSDEVGQVQDVFFTQFNKIYDIWKTNAPCNILYCGPDTLMKKPTEIFNKFDTFRMFNYGCDLGLYSFSGSIYNVHFEHFCNADVRYYPSQMNNEVWEIGFEMLKTFDYNEWNTEQIIWNQMLWSQNIPVEDVIIPELAYQAIYVPGGDIELMNKSNNCNFDDAHILHFHASRGIQSKLEYFKTMELLLEKNDHEESCV